MIMAVYFLNHRSFNSKEGKEYNVLTVCDQDGEVSEFFHDSKMFIPHCSLFDPLDLDVKVTKYRGNTRLELLQVSAVNA